MDNAYLDMGAEIAAFRKLAEGTSCRIGGGLERFSKLYGYAGNDMLYAAASSFWHQGASCIYLFNYDCHRLPRTGSECYTPDEVPAAPRDPRPATDRPQEQALHRERGHAVEYPGAGRGDASSL